MNAAKADIPFPDDVLRDMARDMDVALYRRYDETEGAKIIGVPKADLAELRKRGEIAYLLIGGAHIGFLGRHLLTYLLECVVPAGANDSEPETAPADSPTEKPTISPEAELVSVHDAMTLLGIGRTKLYELLNTSELDSVKIGRRTLIRRASLQRFTSAPSQ